jgi:hypothetical protein
MGYRLKLQLLTQVCGKVRHYTKTAADAHRAALARWDQTIGTSKYGTVTTYWCDQCSAYHVGHTSRQEHP